MNDTGPGQKPQEAFKADRGDPICCKNNKQFDRVNKTIIDCDKTPCHCPVATIERLWDPLERPVTKGRI